MAEEKETKFKAEFRQAEMSAAERSRRLGEVYEILLNAARRKREKESDKQEGDVVGMVIDDATSPTT